MRIIVIAFLLTLGFQANATHIVGGEVYYDSLGNDQYLLTFEIYRDCSGSGFDNPLDYTVFNADGSIYAVYTIALPTPDTLPVIYDDPCVTAPTDICIERAIYVQTITLPTTVNGYYVTYQRCCWAGNILNIVTPGSWGITIKTTIPGTGLVGADNNCARFNEYPPIVLCSNNTLDFDHSATDIDGDSLVYSICTPKTVNIAVGAQPNPEAPEPYADIPWEVGFSGTVPLGPGSNVTIDPQTGMMAITPSLIGTYVMAVCVDEYRNGILINSKSRTFGYRVVVCEVEIPMTVDVVGSAILIEDCGSAGFIVIRDDTTESVDLQIFLSGTATSGTDYNQLPTVLTLPIGVATDTIAITPFLDGLLEGDETIIFSIVVENPCEQTYDTTTAYITVQDYVEMQMGHTDSINVCDESEATGQIACWVQNGVGPYFYSWNPNFGNDSVSVFPTNILNPNLNLMSVEVFDQCGKVIESAPIRVYNQCTLVAPNVITSNGDGINETFIVKNWEDYDRVSLMIFNRWGNLVYENDNYQNDWDGTDMKGTELTEGTYTYLVTPESVKYIYDDVERSKYTAHGFVYIIKD
ncbi:MAG: gliding motility-associated C-terminal domain-containing protein [Crocinitomicaceae bacterium]|nr:gliding motility-associated C-terminal domain-containing protein [Crocinitomicaceae bacterium]